MKGITVALVGCGYVANDHIRAWKKVPQARIIAISDINENLAKSTAMSWKIPRHYKTLSDMVKNEDSNLIDICTPPQTHADLAIQAMKSGMNVLIEKPMTMTAKDAEDIVKCQENSGLKAGVIHNWLFEPPVLEAESLVKRGLLGPLFGMQIEALSPKEDSMAANKNHWSHRLPGGRFSEMLAHPIYLVRHFLGEIESSHVEVSKIGDYPWMMSDELCATLRVEDKLGRAYASFNAPRDAIFISLYGKKAIIRLDVINSTINFLNARKTTRLSKGLDSLRQSFQLLRDTTKNASKIASGSWLSGHDMYIKRFAESLIANSDPPVSAKEGYLVVKTLEEMCKQIEAAERKS